MPRIAREIRSPVEDPVLFRLVALAVVRAIAGVAVALCFVLDPVETAAEEAGAILRSDFGFTEKEIRRVLRMSPLPPLPEDPSNAVADDPAAAAFGERLFFDVRLSGSGDMSCATCHDPERDWVDGARVAAPDARFPKNTPSLWNTAYNRWYYWDGRADSAWAQALGPIESELEMGGDRLRALHVVASDPVLRSAYVELFGPLPQGYEDRSRFPASARPMADALDHPHHRAWASMSRADREAATRFFVNLGKAIASFERTLLLSDTPFDRFVAISKEGDGRSMVDSGKFPPTALRGLKLFVGRGQCTLCHSGPMLSDGEFHNVGLALGAGGRIDPGRHRGVLQVQRSAFTRVGPYRDAPTPSAPIEFLDPRTRQLSQFKTPMLRNVARTAPYMHDGRFETLTDIVRFYSTREGAVPIGHSTTLLQPLNLGESEIEDLVAFLETLTSH